MENRNNTNFTSVNDEYNKTIAKNYEYGKNLKDYQENIVKYIVETKFRSYMVYAEPGMGKTRIASYICELLRQKGERVMFIGKKSLHEGFRNETIENLNISPEDFDNHYIMITADAYNFSQKITDIYDKRFEKLPSHFKNFGFENSVVVIDEAQEYFNAVVSNPNGNAYKVHQILGLVKNLKIVYLTGKPVINHPFELVIPFDKGTFPPDYEQFCDMFIDKEGSKMINKDKFKARILGSVAYMGTEFINSDKHEEFITENKDPKPLAKKENYPLEYPLQVMKLDMDDKHHAAYQTVRHGEIEDMMKKDSIEKTKKKPISHDFAMPQKSMSSGFRVKSRGISMFDVTAEPDDEHLKKNLKRYSVKFDKALDLISKNKNHKSLVFCEYTNAKYGLDKFKHILRLNGYSESHGPKCYATVSGEESVEEREKTMRIFNDRENMRGAKISVLLVSSVAALGLTFKDTTLMIMLTCPWNFSTMNQVKKRISRLMSHQNLPEKERVARSYLLLASHESETTTDVYIYNKALEKEELTKQFLKALIESAFNCSLMNKNKNIGCFSCKPTGKYLYHENIYKDILLKSPCENPNGKEDEEVEEIVFNGEKFYFNSRLEIFIKEKNEISKLNEDSAEFKFIRDYIKKNRNGS